MKRKPRKRLAAFKVGLALSILITPFCFYKIAQPVSALNNVITENNYGSFSRGVRTLSFNGTTYFSMAFVEGNLNGIYNGSVQINLANASPLSNFAIICENCHVVSTGTNVVTIEFYGVSQWFIYFESDNATIGNFNVLSLTNWNMTYLERSDSAVQVNIQNRLTTLQNYVDGIEGLLSTANGYLNTIANNPGGSSSSTVNNIDVNVDLIADDLSLIHSETGGILSSLLDFLTDGVGGYIALSDVIDAIDNTTNQLIDVNTNLTNIYNTLSGIRTTLTNIDTNLSNIDSLIDTISWQSYTTPSAIKYSYDGSTYNNYSSGDLSFTNTGKIYLQLTSQAYRYTRLYKLTLPFYYYNSANNGGFHLVSVDPSVGSTASSICSFYLTGATEQIVIYFAVDSSINASSIYIEFESDVKKGSLSSRGSMSLSYISPDDIEYWQMLQFFDQYKYNKLILEAIKNVSISVSNNTEQNTINNINNYDSNFTQIHTVEDNYYNNFTNNNTNIVSDLNTKLQAPQGFLSATNFIKALFPRVVDNSAIVGFPYFLIIAAIVLFCLLG